MFACSGCATGSGRSAGGGVVGLAGGIVGGTFGVVNTILFGTPNPPITTTTSTVVFVEQPSVITCPGCYTPPINYRQPHGVWYPWGNMGNDGRHKRHRR
ncbi:MAG: hypothetical protein US25_C0070G0002 [Candidatus Moranbacteria bacterium GW2011_GWE1_36_7]|nr:MAG: hypothetical protein US25_C0070G0002 [Candidatus Moranbacteria bacterium GW2011_GWE1_36_7]